MVKFETMLQHNYCKHTPNEKRVYAMNDGRKRTVTVKRTLTTYYDLCSE